MPITSYRLRVTLFGPSCTTGWPTSLYVFSVEFGWHGLWIASSKTPDSRITHAGDPKPVRSTRLRAATGKLHRGA